ncbi:MAG: histidine phosphatase family protein [Acidobacteria bacterium]|nr:histidine phosphatase family protein [Acidobacteriota bacterium]
MSFLYFFRHGQAGPRDDYDTLSDTGRAQARCLGEYLAAQPVRFSAVLSGGLRRQRETMEGVAEAYARAGIELPAPAIDAGWDEFDLFGIYAQVAPRMCAEDPAFREAFEKERQIAQSPDSRIHRQWTACDSALLHAWLDNRYQVEIESWPAFLERVRGNRQRIPVTSDGEAIAIFTSATPMSVWVASALEAGQHKIMRLTGAVYNSAMTVLRLQDGHLDLVTFNATPHLAAPELRTLR